MKKLLLQFLTLLILLIVCNVGTQAQENALTDFERLDLPHKKEDYLPILKTYNECLESAPTYQPCIEKRGVIYFYLKEYDQAISDLNRALTTEPQKAFTLYCRGMIFKSKANYGAALADFTKANALLPDVKKILIARAETYLQKKDYQAALADLNQLISKLPSDFTLYMSRGIFFADQQNYQLAAADFSQVIKLNSGFADAYYQRAQAYVHLNEATKSQIDFVRAAKLDPKYAGSVTTASTTTASNRSTVNPVSETASANSVAVKSVWKRSVLTGTGISIEAPVSFQLIQDKPDPLMENQTAYVLWALTTNNVFANVVYEKNSDRKTPRQQIDSFAEISAGSHKMTNSKIVETTFLNQPAAILSQQYFDAKKNKEILLLQLCYGAPGELTTFTTVYPADDAVAKTTAQKIYNSIKTEGERIAETPKMPAADWQFTELNGLHYETPTKIQDPKCREDFSKFFTSVDCFHWSYLTVRIGYRKYADAAAAPASAKLAVDEAHAYEEMNKTSILNDKVSFDLSAFPIGGAESTKLKIVRNGRVETTNEEIIFVRRGFELWKVSVYHMLRWKFDDEAADRIIRSLQKFSLSGSQTVPLTPVLTDADRYKRTLEDLRGGKKVSDDDIKWALQYEKNHPQKKIN